MRVSLFVSALFVASLFGAVASADQPGDSGGRTARIPNVREMRVQPVREVREARPHETPQLKVRDTQMSDRLRARGDMVDRYGTSSAGQTRSAPQALQAERNADKAAKKLNARQDAVRNCSQTDDSCAGAARSARVATEAAEKASRQQQQQQRSEVQRMVEKARAEKLREKIMKQLCERRANTCAENL